MSRYYNRLRKFEFTDILGWSYSRYHTFQSCKRKYYYEYYRKRDSVDIEAEIFRPVSVAMKNFLLSDRLKWLFEEALVSKDDWIIEFEEHNKYGECRIDKLKAYCKVDFLFPIDDQ